MAADPKTAAQNFLNALDTMPKLLEKYQSDNQKLEKDIPVLKEVVESTWRKEPDLKVLKDDLIKLDREIQLSLKPIEESEGQAESLNNGVGGIPAKKETVGNNDAQIPGTLKDVKEIMGDRLVIASVENGLPKMEKKEISKGIKL
ncbi:hypothetical protein SDC9_139528 [bioreactor metagenome]|uniref:Uncharacterized protein n=1 Tax=bioreactor metagenome TaxID=1076179 RepID=A0A645DUX8_9ZZZZ